MAYQDETLQSQQADDMVMEEPPDEDEDIEAMVASYESLQTGSSQPPRSPSLSDEEYEEIFAELAAQESQTQQNQTISTGDRMDTRDEDSIMSF